MLFLNELRSRIGSNSTTGSSGSSFTPEPKIRDSKSLNKLIVKRNLPIELVQKEIDEYLQNLSREDFIAKYTDAKGILRVPYVVKICDPKKVIDTTNEHTTESNNGSPIKEGDPSVMLELKTEDGYEKVLGVFPKVTELTEKKQSGTVITALKEGYEGKVALEALERAGRNKNLHGHVHEILYKDAVNANPKNILTGTKACLAKSANAVRDDILFKQNGKVIQRMQLKDTVGSIDKTVRQVADGKYNRTLLMGTKETTKAYGSKVAKKAADGVKITQKMSSTGISSSNTARIAEKALGKMPTAQGLATAARGAGVVGAAVGAGIEAICSAGDLIDGKISGGEFAGRVTKAGVGSGLSAATGAAAASVATAATTTMFTTTGLATVAAGTGAVATAVAAAPVALGVVAAVAASSLVSSFWDFIWS